MTAIDDLRNDYELVYELTETNATRACKVCREPAALYVVTDGVISPLRCFKHLPGGGAE